MNESGGRSWRHLRSLRNAGCPICGAHHGRLTATNTDYRCGICGSMVVDRIVHEVLKSDLDGDIGSDVARVLLIAVSDCQASLLFDRGEQYRCDVTESASTDFVAEPHDLTGLPDACFDVVVANEQLATRADLELAVGEMSRVLVPNGLLIVPAFGSSGQCLARHVKVRTVCGVDSVTGMNAKIHIARKDARPLDVEGPTAAEISGYAYHLSRKSRRRIVFCLTGSIAAGDQIPVKSAGGKVVGRVAIGEYAGAVSKPAKPWEQGFRLPPRGVYDLDPSLPSGVYTLAGKIPFVHRGEHSAPIAVLLPSNTATAFNPAGGRCLYDTAGEPPADVLSFQRPLEPDLLLAECRPFVRWFANETPYAQDTTYLIDSDLEEPDCLDGVQVLIVIGRSEFWPRKMREHFDEFVDRGGRALLLCSEVMLWQVRLDSMRHRLLRYGRDDPHPDPLLRTTLWRDPVLRYPVYPRTGCERWYGGVSPKSEGISRRGIRIVCPDSPLLAGSGLAGGDFLPLPNAINWDGAPVSGWRDDVPQIDFGDSPPWRHEVIGYAFAKATGVEADPGRPAMGLWMVLRRAPGAGTVIHGGTMGWCGPMAMHSRGPHSDLTRALVLRMLNVLIDDAWPFSSPPEEEEDVSGSPTAWPVTAVAENLESC